MNKLESAMVKAIRDGRNFKSSNTQVIQNEQGGCKVVLHGSPIVMINQNGYIRISDCGYQTNTTKSRLNAVLGSTDYRVAQRDFKWFISNTDGDLFEFTGVATFGPDGRYVGND